MAGKKATPAANEELVDDVEGEGWEEEGSTDIDAKAGSRSAARSRDWRDVEKFREMRELRRLVDDDFGLDEVGAATAAARPLAVKARPKLKGKKRA